MRHMMYVRSVYPPVHGTDHLVHDTLNRCTERTTLVCANSCGPHHCYVADCHRSCRTAGMAALDGFHITLWLLPLEIYDEFSQPAIKFKEGCPKSNAEQGSGEVTSVTWIYMYVPPQKMLGDGQHG